VRAWILERVTALERERMLFYMSWAYCFGRFFGGGWFGFGFGRWGGDYLGGRFLGGFELERGTGIGPSVIVVVVRMLV
jgi:hypothetical protein